VTPPTNQEVPRRNYWAEFPGLYARFYAWLLRRMPSERQRLLAVTIVAGGICGLAAVAFHLSIMGLEALFIERANTAPGHSWIGWTILSPTIGGLIAGVGLTYFAPAAAGSGIPQVKVAYTLRNGMVTVRETIGKFVLCALQIGSGASLGLEGPTVQVCAGVSSMLARLARLGPKNSRRMASVGMAAGIAAAFNAPIAAVTFTLEELIGDLDQTMLSGVIVAAALAAVVEHLILGSNPVFMCRGTTRSPTLHRWCGMRCWACSRPLSLSPSRILCWAFAPGFDDSQKCLAGCTQPSAGRPQAAWRSLRSRSSTSTASRATHIGPLRWRSRAR